MEKDDYPIIDINVSGEPCELTWDNTTLFTFRDKEYDHIFREYEGEEDERGRQLGMYIFRLIGPTFDDLANLLMENDFTHIHQPIVPECDKEAWERANLKDLEQTDHIPDEWV